MDEIKAQYLEMRKRKSFEIPQLKPLYEPSTFEKEFKMTEAECENEMQPLNPINYSVVRASRNLNDFKTISEKDKYKQDNIDAYLASERIRVEKSKRLGVVISLERDKFWNKIGL